MGLRRFVKEIIFLHEKRHGNIGVRNKIPISSKIADKQQKHKRLDAFFGAPANLRFQEFGTLDFFLAYICAKEKRTAMRTKFHIITGGTSHEVSPTDIRNWSDVKFTLERKDFSGVMRSFSSEFEFVGAAFTLLRDLYLADGFLAAAEIAVSTKNNDWTYTEQFRCPLDFSTVEIENGVMTINSIDNTLAGLIKAQKSTKFQFDIAGLDTTFVEVRRIAIANSQQFAFYSSDTDRQTYPELRKGRDAIVTTTYIEPHDETHVEPAESFFAKVIKIGATMQLHVSGLVRCYFSPTKKGLSYTNNNQLVDIPICDVQVRTLEVDQANYVVWTTLFNDDLLHFRDHGMTINALIGGKDIVFETLDDLKAAAGTLYNGKFGIVRGDGGTSDPGQQAYWLNNIVYEYQNGFWINKGAPENYYQDRNVSVNTSLDESRLTEGCYVQLWCTEKLKFMYASMGMTWNDPVSEPVVCRAVSPMTLATKIVQAISPTASVTIAEDDNGRLAKTYLVAGEVLRGISTAKVYTTFQQFADWLEAVFGYTYRINGNAVEFAHRSAIFGTDVVKVIGNASEVKYAVQKDLIYAEVQAGYGKKEYGEINGRFEKNFTNYYTTSYNATDKKLQLISKYRADVYGVEFTVRKGESETKDDKADEDIFALICVSVQGSEFPAYLCANTVFNPSYCVANNAAFIAVFGNGKAVTLTMTSSDGDNELVDVPISAGTALFTAGELEFTTDDMDLPDDWDGLIQIDHDDYRYRGYISKAEANYGRQSGMEYKLIVKDITKL